MGVSAALVKILTLISDVLEDVLSTHHVKPAGCYVIADIGRHEPSL